MKKYAVIVACLAWAFSANLYSQTSSGGAGASGATGGAAGTGGGTAIGGAPSAQPGVPPPRSGPRANPGLRPNGPNTAPNQAVPGSSGTGAIGGVGPGTGATGGNLPGTTRNPLDNGASAITGTQPGAQGPGIDAQTGAPGAATPGTPAGLQTGVTTQPGVGIGQTGTGTAADLATSQRVRGALLNSGSVIGTPNAVAAAQARGLPAITPQSLAHVQISANGGTVTLQGQVRSEVEKRLLETRVRLMPGVAGVVNHLQVNPAGTPQGVGTPGRAGTAVGTGAATSGTPAAPAAATQLQPVAPAR